jgi:glutathione S-transferase
MSSYKLTYFDVKGKGEIIRFLFVHAGVSYEDHRIQKEQWAEIQPTMPFGVVPVLDVDGTRLGGTLVIARYLAEQPEFNLAGSNSLENAHIAAIGDSFSDIETELSKIFALSAKPNDKEEAKKNFVEKTIPKIFVKLEALSSAGTTPYLWGDKLTWLDFYYTQIAEWVKGTISPDALKEFPSLNKLVDTVYSFPKIAQWIKERPVTEF